MADEASGRDLEPLVRSRTGDSVHGSQDRDGADLASSSARKQTKLVVRPHGAIREAGTGLCFGKDPKRHGSAHCYAGRKARP